MTLTWCIIVSVDGQRDDMSTSTRTFYMYKRKQTTPIFQFIVRTPERSNAQTKTNNVKSTTISSMNPNVIGHTQQFTTVFHE